VGRRQHHQSATTGAGRGEPTLEGAQSLS